MKKGFGGNTETIVPPGLLIIKIRNRNYNNTTPGGVFVVNFREGGCIVGGLYFSAYFAKNIGTKIYTNIV